MKKILLPFFLCGAILSANTVSVSFKSADPVVPVAAENGAWAGPYTLNVNGAPVLAMCMDDFRNVSGTWTAQVTSLASTDFSKTVLGNTTTNLYGYQLSSSQMYGMEAFLFQQLIQPGADRANLQLAAWALMDPTTLNNVVSANNTTVQNDLFAAYSNMSTLNLANFQILSDVSCKNQEFMVASPEPASFVLLGTTLLAAAAARVVRRKKCIDANTALMQNK